MQNSPISTNQTCLGYKIIVFYLRSVKMLIYVDQEGIYFGRAGLFVCLSLGLLKT